MQVIMDMSRVGLAGQAYTKVPDFAWALGGTSTYYPFDPKEVMAEWERLNPILKQIVETK